MRVAVTGLTGFIGRHVLRELRRIDGVHIVGVHRAEIAKADKAFIGVELIKTDLCAKSPSLINTISECDVLIHLAWGGLPNYNSLHHFENELPLQYAFLSACCKSGLKNLFVAGTCFEYGMSSGELEETDLALPRNPYGYAKDCLRRQLEYCINASNLEVNLTWSRLFYLYGKGQGQNSLYSQLISAINSDQPTFEMSNGHQLRDFSDIRDVAQDIVTLALNGKSNGIVNICSGKPISVLDFVEGVIRQRKSKIKLQRDRFAVPSYEPLAFWGSSKKLKFILNR